MSGETLPVGTRLGKYLLQRLLGKGAMGAVYLAVDELLDRQVAVKTITPTFAGDAQFRARFLREARTLAKLNHPNVVQIYDVHDVGEASRDDLPFLVTEFVDGKDLYTIVRDEKHLPWGRACLLLRQIALGLSAAADRDIVHRDVKPGNILVSMGDVVKVTDFGLAKPLVGDQSLTQAEVVMGTPDYMAPEQAMGRAIDWRADQYALACTMFQMLCGRTPFGDGAPAEICARQVYDSWPDVTAQVVDVPPRLVEILGRMAQKDPARRFGSYLELLDAIDDVLDPGRVRDRERAFVVVTSGGQTGLRVRVADRPLIVGRLPECDLALEDARASRKHAAFQYGSEGLEVRDLGSRNGLLVNDRPTRWSSLVDGDRVKLGDTSLCISIERVAPDPALALAAKASAFDGVDVTAERPMPDAFTVPAPEPSASVWKDAHENKGPSALTRVVSRSAAQRMTDASHLSRPGVLRCRRVDVVVVRFNLTGVVRLADALDPDQLSNQLNAAHEVIVDQVFQHQGSLDTLTGDTVLAVFGAPAEVAEAEAKAAAAAYRGTQAVVELQRAHEPTQRLGVRAGVGAGPVVAGQFGTHDRKDYGVIGQAAEIARVLGAMAPADGVLLQDEVARRLGAGFDLQPRPEQTLKLHGHEYAVFVLTGLRSATGEWLR
ncbi:MAG: protein kinase [Pseudomonadota bacterium]